MGIVKEACHTLPCAPLKRFRPISCWRRLQHKPVSYISSPCRLPTARVYRLIFDVGPDFVGRLKDEVGCESEINFLNSPKKKQLLSFRIAIAAGRPS